MSASHSDALVVFGVTGDLAHKMIFPALYGLTKRGALNVPIIGVAFPKWSLAQLHNRVRDSIARTGGIDMADAEEAFRKTTIAELIAVSAGSTPLCEKRTVPT